MGYPAWEGIPGPDGGSAGRPVVRRHSFEGAGPAIAAGGGHKEVKFRVRICAPHTHRPCWRPGRYLFEDFRAESVTLQDQPFLLLFFFLFDFRQVVIDSETDTENILKGSETLCARVELCPDLSAGVSLSQGDSAAHGPSGT